MQINLFDDNGIYIDPITYKIKSCENIDFVFKQMQFDGITIFTDCFLFSDVVDNVKCQKKIAWLFEPKILSPNIYDVYKVEHKFDYIFTYDETLLARGDKYKLVPAGCCWIALEHQQIHKKSKLTSCIMSSKRFLPGHCMRFDIYNGYRNRIDFYGKVCKPIKTKDVGLNDYMFSVCIENNITKNYFTEKLIDCFMTGTVPIYYGCNNVGDFFDVNGILSFSNIKEFDNIINNISPQLYESLSVSIKNNFEIAKQYISMEDWIYDKYLLDLIYLDDSDYIHPGSGKLMSSKKICIGQ